MSDAMEDEKLKAIRARHIAHTVATPASISNSYNAAHRDRSDLLAIIDRLTARPATAGSEAFEVGGVAWQLERFGRLYGTGSIIETSRNGRAVQSTELQTGPGSWVEEAKLTCERLRSSATTPAAEVTREQIDGAVVKVLNEYLSSMNLEAWPMLRQDLVAELIPLLSGATVAVDRWMPIDDGARSDKPVILGCKGYAPFEFWRYQGAGWKNVAGNSVWREHDEGCPTHYIPHPSPPSGLLSATTEVKE